MAEPPAELPASNKPDASRPQGPTEQWYHREKRERQERLNKLTETQEQQEQQKVEALQGKFSSFVDQAHELSSRGANQEVHSAMVHEFNEAYRELPEGTFLKIGLTPEKWYQLHQSSQEMFQRLTEKEETPAGPRYVLRVSRFLSPQDQKPNTTSLNISIIGGQPDETPRFGFLSVSSKSSQNLGAPIIARDITSIEVTRANPKP